MGALATAGEAPAQLRHDSGAEAFGLNYHRKFLAITVLLLLTLLLAGCPPHVSIADINRDPGRYANKDISVSGHVSSSFGAFGTGAYEIDDGTGKMWIYSQNGGVPGNGVKVVAVGRIQQGISIGGRSFATVLRETKRER